MDNSDPKSLAERLLSDGPHKTYSGAPRRIRILHNHTYVADSRNCVYIWEHPYYPYFYVPRSDFAKDLQWHEYMTINDGIASVSYIDVKGAKLSNVISFGDHPNVPESLRGLVRVDFKAADAWFEESAPMLVHPKDPFRRVEVLPSTSHIKISLNGVKLAETSFAMHLYETGLPVRYYLPFTDIDHRYLRPSNKRTQCPYKGEAEYFDVVLTPAEGGESPFEGLVWYYNAPITECASIKGLACFYNEKVDVEVDGVQHARPKTKFA